MSLGFARRLALGLFLAACGEVEPLPIPEDAGVADAASPLDAGPDDAGRQDAGTFPCEGQPGTHPDQAFEIDGETRRYWLHVPAAYRCDRPMAVLVDFHGTAGSPAPEIAYRTEPLVELADDERFIVVRPRSRSSNGRFGEVFRWDENPGDLAKNRAYALALLEDLALRYNLDPRRIYASGFSSGTNMIAQLMADPDHPFSGFGFVAGGYWNDPGFADLDLSRGGLRVYASSGYRDYLYGAQRDLVEALLLSGLPESAVFTRETDTGHELYPWHFEELWTWLDEGARPTDGELSPFWTLEPLFTTHSLLQIAATPSGGLLVSTARGEVHRRSPLTGDWALSNIDQAADVPLSALCALSSGRALAAGEGRYYRSDDEGQTFSRAPPIPEAFGAYFFDSRINSIACSGSHFALAGGYWNGVRSIDGGDNWTGAKMEYAPGLPAQIAAIAIGTASAAVAAGYFYLGRSDDLLDFEAVDLPVPVEWLNDVAAAGDGHFWVVGEGGLILHSANDGLTFEVQPGPAPIADLYAVDFYDADVGMVVGAHGKAYFTDDGGQRWIDVSVGLDRFLGDVKFLSRTQALVVGERGLAVVYGL